MSLRSLHLFLLVSVLCYCSNAIRYNQNYYLGKFENRESMDILFSRSQRSESLSGREEWLAETLTYPLHLGPYGGTVKVVHVHVTQSSSYFGRLTLTKGHIGGTFFEIIVEAENTLYLVCNYTVYGQKPFTRAQRVRFPKKRRKDEL